MDTNLEMLLMIVSDPLQLIREGKTYVILLPVYTLLLLGERILHEMTRREQWDNKDSAANLVITGAMMLRDVFLGAYVPLGVFILLYEHGRLFALPEVWWGWLAVFVLYDFCWYVDHWLGHRTGLFWAFHQVHHSSEEYNMTVASRGFIFEFLHRPAFYLMPIMGVSPIMYITMKVVTNIWGIAQHTRLVPKLGLLDWLFATPSTHRVHHGSDPEYLDRNYGEILMIWDHLFGTYTAEKHEPKYGLTENIQTYNPIAIEVSGLQWLFAQVRSADRWQDKLAYLWQPPGWRHDGKGKTTVDLQRADGIAEGS